MTDTDVVIVGNGPVGATLSVLLAQRGWRVTVLERRPRPYKLPRATSFDGETARLLAATGIGPDLGRITAPANGYQWQTADGRTLLDIAFTTDGRYGWPDANTMHQPSLEELIAARAAALPGITVLRGHEVVAIADGEHVRVTAVDPDEVTRTLSARWVVGCDGANSFVREHLDVPVTDLGFSYEWLLCDVQLTEPREFVPTNVQICDPARPTTLVGSGPGRRRWEFMRLPGENAAELNKDETAWRLMAPFGVTPETATLLRSTTYIFQARWADRWRVGHVLLAGDAAHLMPPFAGQGMCSGVRDVTNLAWKLDLTLRGLAPESLLDSYGAERREQAREAILASVQLGRVICVTDPAAAAERDATVLANRRGKPAGRPEPAKPLTGGLLHESPGAGVVVPQGRVCLGGTTGLFDDVVGRGFVLLTTEDVRSEFLSGLGTHVVRLADGVDVDDVYRPFLARFGAASVLVRPDYHVFGTAGPGGFDALVDALQNRLRAAVPTA
ncbi:bifunctional 3-(3-hydroxy-phenyl)propionate/3-hydroxycinnamic acid hydroxylase [Amycolatopsis sp. Hca4]|uniref:bifunctional 3-(3-hydroxy-phenyl)propionate/3-hydroxycinnamic acid hydroxylase MhpA n=1 Tax=Amycolatopsis sp. Hca4 TaxID=2742131 RepID=UPI000D5A63D5|nr:bifunctional 3-(3-hydroxy-phenyl)propionate/3-hydroxycinnamic acid hydroxylase [Amycolatopsis sp. Hca4]AWH12639.1 Rmp19 [Amycolatopsis sp.]QKV76525.1 bifunctional 3-(3-hydroxy-phenyl)propionate/3-hydroxycinnamic acid hydroxylase [Amycolatopsis sp. Hca4]